MRLALFGMGDAGSRFGADLAAAGVEVHGYDPADVPTPAGVCRHGEPRPAVAGVDVVLGLTAAADAPEALAQALDDIPAAAVYADLSTAARSLKQQLAATAAARGLAFADVALMAVVAGKGLHTPVLVSGSGAEAFAALFRPLGTPVELAGDEAGMAATRKLLRSVMIKGMTAVLIEAMRASAAAGLAAETWGNLVDQFAAADEVFLQRLVSGTGPHAARRLHEMEAAADLLDELGIEPLLTSATVESLRRIESGEIELPLIPALVRDARRPPRPRSGPDAGR
jgi:3-hydroxyisobutyrate dehydrogenase-like beta-hydroxyacid dehydrogenase